MNGLEVADPYVERLLEGVGFLAARVQLKLDAEFPRFTQALLEIVYPHYLAPTPSMLVAQLQPDTNEPSLADGTDGAARHHAARAVGTDDATACEFRTAHDVTLLPIEIARPSYFSFAPELPLNTLPIAQRIKGGLRIRLTPTAGIKFEQLARPAAASISAAATTWRTGCYELCLATDVRHAGAPRRARRMARVTAAPVDPACRLRRPPGAAAGHAALVPGLSAAAGGFLPSAALPILRAHRPRARRCSA